MSLLAVEQITKFYGSRMVFDSVSFHIEKNDRVGLVGENGAGKTTLFKLLTGQEEPDSGYVMKATGLHLGTMAQHVPEDTVQTAREFMLAVFTSLLQLETEMEQVQQQLEAGQENEDLLLRQQILRERFEAEGGLTFRSRVEATLTGLGFSGEQKELPLSALSGGQRSKLGLARLLVCPADLLLLDEPTNHLDMAAIGWLEEFLQSYNGSFIVISHDRYFLDRVTTATMELERGTLRFFRGNYTAFLQYKKEQREVEQHHYQQQLKEIKRLEEAVTEMRRWNREKSIKRAESKQKVIDKLTDSLQKPEEELQTIHFSFTLKQPCPTEMLNAYELSFGFSKQPLYQNLTLQLRKGERVFLIGPNGCGKTTLLKQLLGQVSGQGTISLGPGVTVGYYDQIGGQLHHEKTVLNEVWDDFTKLDQTALRSALAAFLFRGEDVFKTVGQCSGGERARIALLKTMLRGDNLLFLDEPTNHLDIGSREALETALASYEGTLFMVSHDRYFINKLASRIVLLTPFGLQVFDGDYDAFVSAMEQVAIIPEKKSGPGAGGQEYKAKKQRDSEIRKLKTTVAHSEEMIHHWEQQTAALRSQMENPDTAADYMKMLAITSQLEEAEQAINDWTEQWALAIEKLEDLQAQ